MEASSSNFLCLPEDPTELTELAPGYRGWLMHVLGRPNRSRNPVTIQYSREDDPAFLGAGAIVSGWRVSIRAPGFIFIFRGLRGADCAAPLEAIELVCRQLLELTVGGIDSTDNVNPTIYNPRKCYNPAAEFETDEPRMGHLFRLLWKRWHFELDRGLRDLEDPLCITVSQSLAAVAAEKSDPRRRESTHVDLRSMRRRESIVEAVKVFTALEESSADPSIYRATIQWKEDIKTAGGPYRKAEMALEHAAILFYHQLASTQEWQSLPAYEQDLQVMGVCMNKLACYLDDPLDSGQGSSADDRRHSLSEEEQQEDAAILRQKAVKDRIRSLRKSFLSREGGSGISGHLYEQQEQQIILAASQDDRQPIVHVPVRWPGHFPCSDH